MRITLRSQLSRLFWLAKHPMYSTSRLACWGTPTTPTKEQSK